MCLCRCLLVGLLAGPCSEEMAGFDRYAREWDAEQQSKAVLGDFGIHLPGYGPCADWVTIM